MTYFDTWQVNILLGRSYTYLFIQCVFLLYILMLLILGENSAALGIGLIIFIVIILIRINFYWRNRVCNIRFQDGYWSWLTLAGQGGRGELLASRVYLSWVIVLYCRTEECQNGWRKWLLPTVPLVIFRDAVLIDDFRRLGVFLRFGRGLAEPAP